MQLTECNGYLPDQPAQLHCEACADDYCEVCFAAQHRKGSRKSHPAKPLSVFSTPAPNNASDGPQAKGGSQEVSTSLIQRIVVLTRVQMDVDDAEGDSDDELEHLVTGVENPLALQAQPEAGSNVGEWFVERSKFIPLRLTFGERKYLRLLEAALNVSEYTDKIDTIGFQLSKAKRIVHQIRELCAILGGLVLSADYKQGQELFSDRDFAANEEFYQQVFELGRRHKIMNPDKMRSTYGKLIYLLQVSTNLLLASGHDVDS